MFRLAVKHHMVQTNPMSDVDRPKPKQSRIVRPLTPIQVEGIRARMEPRDALLVSILAYKELLEHRLSIGRPSDSTLIFPAHDGGFWSSSDWRNLRQRSFADAVEAIGLPKETRPYDLRHSAVSLAIASGANVVRVAKQLGHSPTMLLERYAHVFEEFEDGNVDPEALIVSARNSLSSAEHVG
jgi:site-specific recombinase XerD